MLTLYNKHICVLFKRTFLLEVKLYFQNGSSYLKLEDRPLLTEAEKLSPLAAQCCDTLGTCSASQSVPGTELLKPPRFPNSWGQGSISVTPKPLHNCPLLPWRGEGLEIDLITMANNVINHAFKTEAPPHREERGSESSQAGDTSQR